jgi:hypothetical protein
MTEVIITAAEISMKSANMWLAFGMCILLIIVVMFFTVAVLSDDCWTGFGNAVFLLAMSIAVGFASAVAAYCVNGARNPCEAILAEKTSHIKSQDRITFVVDAKGNAKVKQIEESSK